MEYFPATDLSSQIGAIVKGFWATTTNLLREALPIVSL